MTNLTVYRSFPSLKIFKTICQLKFKASKVSKLEYLSPKWTFKYNKYLLKKKSFHSIVIEIFAVSVIQKAFTGTSLWSCSKNCSFNDSVLVLIGGIPTAAPAIISKLNSPHHYVFCYSGKAPFWLRFVGHALPFGACCANGFDGVLVMQSQPSSHTV